jgi:hypothetical protein
MSGVLRGFHRIHIFSFVFGWPIDEFRLWIYEFLLWASKYFKAVFAAACSIYVGVYLEKGFPERVFHASLQNSLVVILLYIRKRWKVSSIVVNIHAANTYTIRRMLMMK